MLRPSGLLQELRRESAFGDANDSLDSPDMTSHLLQQTRCVLLCHVGIYPRTQVRHIWYV